ncbi:MAG: hypothetical protein WBQ94_03280 [Terracidiphilus sp.]
MEAPIPQKDIDGVQKRRTAPTRRSDYSTISSMISCSKNPGWEPIETSLKEKHCCCWL